MWWKVIQEELNKRKWSLQRLADESGIPDNTLKTYKFGHVEPGFFKIIKIADTLDISLDDLRKEEKIK